MLDMTENNFKKVVRERKRKWKSLLADWAEEDKAKD
jgi:hypothetical protein